MGRQSVRDWIFDSILLRGFRTTVELLVRAGFDEKRATALVQEEHGKIMGTLEPKEENDGGDDGQEY